MSQSSQTLGQAVFQALVCAQSAAAIHIISVDAGRLTYDEALRDTVKKVSDAAYASSAHAWMAMLALSSNPLEIAQSAAQSAYDAEQVALQAAVLSNIPNTKIYRCHDDFSTPPCENDLKVIWWDLCTSLSDEFPVPDNLHQSLSPVFTQDEGDLS